MLTSKQNPKVKFLIHLRDRKGRKESGEFLIEGYREILRAIEGGIKLSLLFISPELFLGENEERLIARAEERGAVVIPCVKSVFEHVSYRDRPDGLLAIGKQWNQSLEDLEKHLSSNPLLVVAEAIEKPGNLGTILRSSDGVGADGVIVCDRCTDIFNPNVVRSSVGCLFTRPVIEARGEETMAWLKKKGILIVAGTPSASHVYTEVDLSGPVAIAVGTEQLGLSDLWMKQADIQVRIPMCGVADSLNVAGATTLLLYEALRQRGKK